VGIEDVKGILALSELTCFKGLLGPLGCEPSIPSDLTLQGVGVTYQRGEIVPFIFWGSEFENLEMTMGQATSLPAHPLASTDVEVTATRSKGLANVEDGLTVAALGECPFQPAVRVVEPAPVHQPGYLGQHFDAG
jgi:hypothetical protein